MKLSDYCIACNGVGHITKRVNETFVRQLSKLSNEGEVHALFREYLCTYCTHKCEAKNSLRLSLVQLVGRPPFNLYGGPQVLTSEQVDDWIKQLRLEIARLTRLRTFGYGLVGPSNALDLQPHGCHSLRPLRVIQGGKQADGINKSGRKPQSS